GRAVHLQFETAAESEPTRQDHEEGAGDFRTRRLRRVSSRSVVYERQAHGPGDPGSGPSPYDPEPHRDRHVSSSLAEKRLVSRAIRTWRVARHARRLVRPGAPPRRLRPHWV